MKNQKLIDNAFEAFYTDELNWYEVSNLCYEELGKADKQYLFDRVEQLCTEKVMPRELLDILRWAITEKLNVSKDAIDKFGSLFLSSDCATESGFACEIAKLYRKETYMENGGALFDSPENVKKWIEIAFDLASQPVDYIFIIENVAQDYSGLHLGDKKWGKALLVQAQDKVDNKTYKKIEKSTAHIFN